MIYYANIQNNLVQGFYCKEIHGDNIPEGSMPITEELWQELLKMGQAEVVNKEKLNSVPMTIETETNEEFALDVKYLDCFKQHIIEVSNDEQAEYVPVETRMTNLEDKVDILTNQISQLVQALSLNK